MKAKAPTPLLAICGLLPAVCCLLSGAAVAAEDLPSLFRGMTVGAGAPGVTIIFVKADAFAVAAGLRAGDHITAIEDRPINGLEDFAEASHALAGHRTDAVVTVLRGGTRVTMTISLTSAAVRSAWGLSFLPDYSLRFVEPNAARRYWSQRAAKEIVAGEDVAAMRSLLNVLHYAPESYDEALALCEAIARHGERLWQRGKRVEAIGVLQQGLALYRQAATKPLTLQQWQRLKRGLQELSDALKRSSPSTA